MKTHYDVSVSYFTVSYHIKSRKERPNKPPPPTVYFSLCSARLSIRLVLLLFQNFLGLIILALTILFCCVTLYLEHRQHFIDVS